MKTLVAALTGVLMLISCANDETVPVRDYRERLIGYYDVEEYSETYGEYIYYDMYVSRAYYRDEIYLEDIYAENTRVRAIVDFDRITIPYQITAGFEFEGSGVYYNGKLELNYRVRDTYHQTYSDYCSTVAYKF